MVEKIKKRPFHPYDEIILRTLYKSRMQLTPTKIAKTIHIHPETAQRRIKELRRKGLIKCKERGKILLCRLNREKFK